MAKREKLGNSQFNMLLLKTKNIHIRHHYLTFISSLGLIISYEVQY